MTSLTTFCQKAALPIVFAALISASPSVLHASTTFYSDAASFGAIEPGLPFENFSKANLFGQLEGVQDSPISSTTNSGVFTSGSILSGIMVSNLNSANTPGLIVYSGGPGGGAKSVGTNWFGDTLVLSFAPGVTAVGMNVFANTSPSPSLAGSFEEQVYNGATLLGHQSFSAIAGSIPYIGVISTTEITSVRLLYITDDASTFVTNISFGSVDPGPAAAPEPSTFAGGLLSMILLSGIAARYRPQGRPHPSRCRS